MLKYDVDPDLAAAMPPQMLANLGIEPMAKSHVSGYTNKNGTYVAEHEDKRASKQPAKHQQIVDRATYSGGQFEEHDRTSTERHASRSIRVPSDDKKIAHERAHREFELSGLKKTGQDTLTGADKYESDTHEGSIWHNNGTMHVSVKQKSDATGEGHKPLTGGKKKPA